MGMILWVVKARLKFHVRVGLRCPAAVYAAPRNTEDSVTVLWITEMRQRVHILLYLAKECQQSRR